MWVFQTEEGPEIIGFTSQSGSTRSNLVKRAMKILGLSKEDMRKGFNTEDLRDKPCQIMVEVRTGDDEDNNIATNFMAPKKGQKAKNLESRRAELWERHRERARRELGELEEEFAELPD